MGEGMWDTILPSTFEIIKFSENIVLSNKLENFINFLSE
jgi:hypothetical protein